MDARRTITAIMEKKVKNRQLGQRKSHVCRNKRKRNRKRERERLRYTIVSPQPDSVTHNNNKQQNIYFRIMNI